MSHQWIAILDLGSPDTQMVARQIRQNHVYSEVIKHNTRAGELSANPPAGIILSYADSDLFATTNLTHDPALLEMGIPVLQLKCDSVLTLQNLIPAPADTPQPYTAALLHDFVFNTCGCTGDWQLATWVDKMVAQLRQQIGDEHVILGLSGGVDSSVVAVLLHRAIGRRLHCIFVDNGLLRHAEDQQVQTMFQTKMDIDLHVVNARAYFYERLRNVTDPETKRKIIGHAFIDIFAEQARKFKDCKYLAQGTIYPDIIESISPLKDGQQAVKSHHNVGGLPPDLKFELIEPLRELFKDEVRAVGRVLGVDAELLERQPFPGPGLGVRILGEVTAERVKILQQADLRVQEELRKLPNYHTIWQAFAVLLPIHSVGVHNHQRTYENVCAIRAVHSVDAMTATWVHLPYATLETISRRIIQEVPGINRVVYDISNKPPATIEWE